MVLNYLIEPSNGFSFVNSNSGDIVITHIRDKGRRMTFGVQDELTSSITLDGYDTYFAVENVRELNTNNANFKLLDIFYDSNGLNFGREVFNNNGLSFQSNFTCSQDSFCTSISSTNVFVQGTTQVVSKVVIGRFADAYSQMLINTNEKSDMFADSLTSSLGISTSNADLYKLDADRLVVWDNDPSRALRVNRSLSITKDCRTSNLIVGKNMTCGGDVSTNRNVFVGNTLQAGSLNIAQTLIANGNLTIVGMNTTTGNVTIKGSAFVQNFNFNEDFSTTFNKDCIIKNLTIYGISFVDKGVTCRNIFTVRNSLEVASNTVTNFMYVNRLLYNNPAKINMQNCDVYGSVSVPYDVTCNDTLFEFLKVDSLCEVNGSFECAMEAQFSRDTWLTQSGFASSIVVGGSLTTNDVLVNGASETNIIQAHDVTVKMSVQCNDDMTCGQTSRVRNMVIGEDSTANAIHASSFNGKDMFIGHTLHAKSIVLQDKLVANTTDVQSGDVIRSARVGMCSSKSASFSSTLTCSALTANIGNGDTVKCANLEATTAALNIVVANQCNARQLEANTMRAPLCEMNFVALKQRAHVQQNATVFGRSVFTNMNCASSLRVTNNSSCKIGTHTTFVCTGFSSSKNATIGSTMNTATIDMMHLYGRSLNVGDCNISFVSQVASCFASDVYLVDCTTSTSNVHSLQANDVYVYRANASFDVSSSDLRIMDNLQTYMASVGIMTSTGNARAITMRAPSLVGLATSFVYGRAYLNSMRSLKNARVDGTLTCSAISANRLSSLRTLQCNPLACASLVMNGSTILGSMKLNSISSLVPLKLQNNLTCSFASLTNLTCLMSLTSPSMSAFTVDTANAIGDVGNITQMNARLLTSTSARCSGNSQFNTLTVSGNVQANQQFAVTGTMNSRSVTSIITQTSINGSFKCGGDLRVDQRINVTAGMTSSTSTSCSSVTSNSIRCASSSTTNQFTCTNVGYATMCEASMATVQNLIGFATMTVPRMTVSATCVASQLTCLRNLNVMSAAQLPSSQFDRLTVFGNTVPTNANTSYLELSTLRSNTGFCTYVSCDTTNLSEMTCLSSLGTLSFSCKSLQPTFLVANSKHNLKDVRVYGELRCTNVASTSSLTIDNPVRVGDGNTVYFRVNQAGINCTSFASDLGAMRMQIQQSSKGNITKNSPILAAFATTGSYSNLNMTGFATGLILNGRFQDLTLRPDMSLYVRSSVFTQSLLDLTQGINSLKDRLIALQTRSVSQDRVDATLCVLGSTLPQSCVSLADVGQKGIARYSSTANITFVKDFLADITTTQIGLFRITYKPIKVSSNVPNQVVMQRFRGVSLVSCKVEWGTTGSALGTLVYNCTSIDTNASSSGLVNALNLHQYCLFSPSVIVCERWNVLYPNDTPFVRTSISSSNTVLTTNVGTSTSVPIRVFNSGTCIFTVFPGTTLVYSTSSSLSNPTTVTNTSWDLITSVTNTSGSLTYFAYGTFNRPFQCTINAQVISTTPFVFATAQNTVNITNVSANTRVMCFASRTPSFYGYSFITETSGTFNVPSGINCVVLERVFRTVPYVRFHADVALSGQWLHFTTTQQSTWSSGKRYIRQFENVSEVLEQSISRLYAMCNGIVAKSCVLAGKSALDVSSDNINWTTFTNTTDSNMNLDLTQYGFGDTNRISYFRLYMVA